MTPQSYEKYNLIISKMNQYSNYDKFINYIYNEKVKDS